MNARQMLILIALACAEIVALIVSAALLLYPPGPGDELVIEARAYDDYRHCFDRYPVGPTVSRGEQELDDLDAALAGELVPPAKYAVAWQERPAVQLYRKWLTDAKLQREQRRLLAEWYRGLINEGTKRIVEPITPAWGEKVASLFDRAKQPLMPSTGPVPGSPILPMPRGAALTFATISESDAVRQARADWRVTARRLSGLPTMWEAFKSLAGLPR